MKAFVFYGKVICLLASLTASGFFGYFMGFRDQAEVNRRAHIENYRVGVYAGLKEAYRRQQAGETALDPVQPATELRNAALPATSMTALNSTAAMTE